MRQTTPTRILETNSAREEGTISYSGRGEIPIYPMPTGCFHPEASGSSKRLPFPRRLAATGTSGRQCMERPFFHLNHALVSSNHWSLSSWDRLHWFATCQTLPHCQLSWTRCRKEPEFVIAKLNGGFVGPMQTKGFPASNVHQTGRITQYVKSYTWASQGHQRTSYMKRFPRDTREIRSPAFQKQSKTQLRACFTNPFTCV